MATLVGKQFPDITVKAIDEMGDAFQLNVLKQAVENKKKVVLFWYPKDFTFVCPTEIHAFQEAAAEFEKRNTIVIGASCDTAEVHFAWLSTAKDNGGIEGVKFPLIADSTRVLAYELGILDYDMYDEEGSNGDNVPYRATYLLDENGMVYHESVNHFPVGRNVHEFIRLIDAFTHVQTHGEVCPANWEEGKDAMKATRTGTAEYLSKH
ncbi:MAG: peroxiredoxin [Flavobacteriales bacterium]|jgi:peroxiredoxin (alkyl hydroperoxide reductase subunit C)|nr:peroxiredoxin [Crocinitomicaceae bacterium]NBX78845.1 peroxiredoxin [Flavobacteriales bacterium]NCA21705.1 peroxiredoxin [Crocinitomicaceae bacterium]